MHTHSAADGGWRGCSIKPDKGKSAGELVDERRPDEASAASHDDGVLVFSHMGSLQRVYPQPARSFHVTPTARR
jgi:hypothetical protein